MVARIGGYAERKTAPPPSTHPPPEANPTNRPPTIKHTTSPSTKKAKHILSSSTYFSDQRMHTKKNESATPVEDHERPPPPVETEPRKASIFAPLGLTLPPMAAPPLLLAPSMPLP